MKAVVILIVLFLAFHLNPSQAKPMATIHFKNR
jgi:hypothetical protein